MKTLIALTLLLGAFAGVARLSSRSPAPPQTEPPKVAKIVGWAPDNIVDGGKTQIVDRDALRRWEEEARVMDRVFESARRAYYAGRTADAERLARRSMAPGASSLTTHAARKLIGRIQMDRGEFGKAAETLSEDWVRGQDPTGDLDIALCYAKVGRFDLAQRFYTDAAVLQYHGASAADLPDASTAKGAEARVLMARGLEALTRPSGKDDAQRDLARAAALDPRNTLVAQMMARALLRDERKDEALPYLATVAAYGKGERRQEAEARVAGYPTAATRALTEAKARR